MEFFVALLFFDLRMGPTVYATYPNQEIEDLKRELLVSTMDHIISEGFFAYYFEDFFSLNYIFEIPSIWARGGTESLMISIIFENHPTSEIEKAALTVCIEFSEWIKSNQEIYTAFYVNSWRYGENQEQKNTIDRHSKIVQTWLIEFFKAFEDEIHEKSGRPDILSLLDREDVINSLKFMANNPKSLAELKDWYTEEYPQNNFYKLAAKLLKNQMIYIPNFGKTKKPPFTAYVTDDIKTIVNLLNLKSKLIDNFIEKREEKKEDEGEDSEQVLKQLLE